MAIAGCCRSSGHWPSPPDIERSLAAMTLRASATRRRPGVHRDSGVVFGRCDEGQLAVGSPRGVQIVSVFDGRLDNRSDLLSSLGEDGLSPTASDCDLAMFAYARWGRDFADRLIGDFACAIWDGSRRSLFLARDAIGARPLFFWRGRDIVFFATEPRGLLAQPQIPRVIDEQWVGRALAWIPQERGASFYRDVECVAAGHVLCVESDGEVRQSRYWRPESLASIRFSRDEAYVEGLRATLDAAVRDRIAGGSRIGGQLSGGLDSGSVIASAARQLQARDLRLTAFTAVPGSEIDPADYPSRIVDEGPLAALTAASFPNVDHVRVQNFAGSPLDAIDRAARAMDCPLAAPINAMWLDAIGEEARRRGIGVLLTGQMGNMTISYNGGGWLVELCRSGRWGELLREFRGLVRQGRSWPNLVNRYMLGRLPSPVRRMTRALAGRPELDFRQYSMIRPEFASRLRLLEQARDIAGDLTNLDRSGVDLRVQVIEMLDLAMYGRAAKRMFGLDVLDPTADRRLVEYCLAIPQNQFLRNGQERSLMLRAMEGVLPEAVLRERRRGLQSADWNVGLGAARDEIVAEIERLARSPLASEALDVPRLRRMAEDWPSEGWGRKDVYLPYCIAFSKGVTVGRFIRQVEGANA